MVDSHKRLVNCRNNRWGSGKTSPARFSRGGAQVLPAGPLARVEQHGTVFNGDFHLVFFRQGDNRLPDFLENLQVFLHRFGLVPADKVVTMLTPIFLEAAISFFRWATAASRFSRSGSRVLG